MLWQVSRPDGKEAELNAKLPDTTQRHNRLLSLGVDLLVTVCGVNGATTCCEMCCWKNAVLALWWDSICTEGLQHISSVLEPVENVLTLQPQMFCCHHHRKIKITTCRQTGAVQPSNPGCLTENGGLSLLSHVFLFWQAWIRFPDLYDRILKASVSKCGWDLETQGILYIWLWWQVGTSTTWHTTWHLRLLTASCLVLKVNKLLWNSGVGYELLSHFNQPV